MDLNSDQRPSRRDRLRWGFAAVFVLMLCVGLIAGRVCTETGTYQMALEDGYVGLSEATRGHDTVQYDIAIRSLSGAAALGFVDHYPVFVLGAAEKMKASAAGEFRGEHQAYYHALCDRDFLKARKYAASVERVQLGQYMARLADALERH